MVTDRNPAMPRSRTVAFVLQEIKEVLPPVIFFAVGFNLVELTTQLVLDDYFARFANYLVATAAALVVGKAVLLANLFPFMRRFDTAPLIQPILFKTVFYTFVVFLVRALEKIVEYWLGGGTITGIPDYVTNHFSWHFHAAVQIWIFVLFFIYTSATELDARLGQGALARILFRQRSSNPKPP
jgi:Ni/Fe-hydrogenase subunit HybB-like protein